MKLASVFALLVLFACAEASVLSKHSSFLSAGLHGSYIFGKLGEDGCPLGSAHLVESECKSAADALSAKYFKAYPGDNDRCITCAEGSVSFKSTRGATCKSVCKKVYATCGDAGGAHGGGAYKCPNGFVFDAAKASTKCAGVVCDEGDRPSCCQALANCGDATCPSGYVLKLGAASRPCAGAACETSTLSSADTANCCVKQATCGNALGDGAAAACPNNWLYLNTASSSLCAGAVCQTDASTSADTATCCKSYKSLCEFISTPLEQDVQKMKEEVAAEKNKMKAKEAENEALRAEIVKLKDELRVAQAQ